MKEKTLRKITVLSILLCLCVGLFTTLNFVNASSAETTGLGLTYTGTNQGTHITLSNYDIFALGEKINIYDSNAELIRTVNVAIEADADIETKIIYLNSTHFIYTSIYEYGRNGKIEAYYVNVNTGITTTIISATTIVTANIGSSSIIYDQLLMTINNNIYFTYTIDSVAGGWNKTGSYRLYPTYAFISASTTTLYLGNGGNSIYIPSQTTNHAYIITGSGTNRFSVYDYDTLTGIYTLIGTSGVDNTFGNYNYYFGYSQNTDGVNNWYDLGIVYNNPTVNKDIYPQIIRFNDTFVGYYRSTLSASSSVNLLRCLSVSYTGIWDRIQLINGDYQFYYVGTSYGIMLCPFTISSLSTSTPTLSISFAPSVFGDNGVQWIHHYTSSTSVGGILVASGNIIELDYQNSKCVVTKWMSLNPSYSYLFSLNPQPLQIISSGTVLRAVCMQSQNYNYTGEVFANGVRVGNGTYQVSSTGLSTSYTIASTGTYGSTSSTGSIINGILTFTITGRTSAYVTIYEGIKVTVTINGASQDYIHTFVWTTNVNEDGLAPSTTSPTQGALPTNNEGMGGTNSINLLSGGTFIGLLITVLFTMLFGAFAGRDGILAGLMLGIMVSSLLGLFPIYGILLSVVFGAILLLSHTSIGQGSGGSNGE